jgi:hypothetical protein
MLRTIVVPLSGLTQLAEHTAVRAVLAPPPRLRDGHETSRGFLRIPGVGVGLVLGSVANNADLPRG